ncbi:MAG: ABC transporter permease [Armatimonadota bacterium]
MSAIADFRELIQRRSVLRHFITTELKTGHRDKVLGNLWQLVDPLSFMLVYYAVWSIILGTRGPDFTAYLLSGIIVFRAFQDSVVGSSTVMRSQARLIKEVYFPKAALPAALAICRLYDFVWALGALLLLQFYLMYQQAHATPEQAAHITHPISLGLNALWLPGVVALLFMFSLGASYLAAVAGALFRDTPNILTFLLRLWFYLSPLFYFPENVPRDIWFLYRINPFTHFFRLFRASLIYNRAPGVDGALYIIGLSIFVLLLGFVVFSRSEGAVVKQL